MYSSPLPYQITEAVQNPQVAFRNDGWLREAKIERNGFGLPRPRSGNFAITFQLENAGERRAVRCFTRIPADMAERYAAIDGFLAAYTGSLLVRSQYRPQGILVNGSWAPVTVMPWIVGSLIWDYVQANLSVPASLIKLRDRIIAANSELESLGAAHGDLQHGNIFIVPSGHVRLVDYDGMFVPALGSRLASEIGHRNYQHPLRTERQFNAHLDRFSTLLIATALEALANLPSLWPRFVGSESLLFRQEDMLDPESSELFAELGQIQGIRRSVRLLRQAIDSSPEALPSVKELLSGDARIRPVRSRMPHDLPTPRERVLDASDPQLWTLTGRRIRVVGRVREIDGVMIGGLFFARQDSVGAWHHTLRLMNPPTIVDGIGRYGRVIPGVGKWLEVTGIVQMLGRIATITVEYPTDVTVLSAKQASEALSERQTARQFLGLDQPSRTTGEHKIEEASNSEDADPSRESPSLSGHLSPGGATNVVDPMVTPSGSDPGSQIPDVGSQSGVVAPGLVTPLEDALSRLYNTIRKRRAGGG